MKNQDYGGRRLGWNWLWFFPLCMAVLLLAERHTVLHALRLGKLAYQRWSWGALFSPSAYFCLCVILASVYWPIQGLRFAALIVTSDDVVETPRRYFWVFLLAVAILLLPFVSDALTWGSFPFNVDNAGIERLRMIPFIPWPDGHFGDY